MNLRKDHSHESSKSTTCIPVGAAARAAIVSTPRRSVLSGWTAGLANGASPVEPAIVSPLQLLSVNFVRSALLRPTILQLSAMDASARVTMKDAAKCDKHCELQNSVNQQNFERILCFRDIPESRSASESPLYTAPLRDSSRSIERCCALVLC